MLCELCNREFQNFTTLGSHIGQSHRDVGIKNYYNRFLKKDSTEVICKNPNCKKEVKFVGLTLGYNNHCSRQCSNLIIKRDKKPKHKKRAEVEKNIDCKICNRKFETYHSLGIHVVQFHGQCDKNFKEVYYNMFLRKSISEGSCKTCRKSTNFVSLNYGYYTYCNTSCSKLDPEVELKTQETCLKNFGVSNYAKSEQWMNWMLNGGAAYMLSFITNPSKPQLKIYEMIKELYPSAKLNQPCLNYSLDIIIPELKIVVEYDGWRFHQNKEYDLKRQRKIEELGWRFIRYQGEPTKDIIPSKEQIINDIDNL